MQTTSLQNIVNTYTFRDFHTPNSALCKSLANHSHKENFSAAETEYVKKAGKFKNAAPLLGAVIGAVLPIVLLNKVSGKKLDFKAIKDMSALDKLKEIGEYFEIDSVKKILSTAAGAIAGGLAGGLTADTNKENRKEKIKEAVFEMTNITVPTLCTAGILKILESKGLNKGFGKALPVVLGLSIGVPLAAKISGIAGKKIFKEDDSEQRKFKPSDLLVHTDDIVAVLALSKIPFFQKIQLDKVLALIYAKCGYEAGSKDEHSKGHHH